MRRLDAAREGATGLQVMTLPLVAARLAGGFVSPASQEVLYLAIRQALEAGVGRPEQFSTVYSGMDAEAFLHPPRPRDEVRRELGLADDETAFATVARLFELKGSKIDR